MINRVINRILFFSFLFGKNAISEEPIVFV